MFKIEPWYIIGIPQVTIPRGSRGQSSKFNGKLSWAKNISHTKGHSSKDSITTSVFVLFYLSLTNTQSETTLRQAGVSPPQDWSENTKTQIPVFQFEIFETSSIGNTFPLVRNENPHYLLREKEENWTLQESELPPIEGSEPVQSHWKSKVWGWLWFPGWSYRRFVFCIFYSSERREPG